MIVGSMPPSKKSEAERAAEATAKSIELAIKGDFRIAVNVMKNNSEVVQHVKNMLLNMGYWPSASAQAAPSASAQGEAAETSQVGPKSGSASPAAESKLPASSAEAIPDAKPAEKLTIGGAVLGKKTKAPSGAKKDLVPHSIHRNFTTWSLVGVNVLKHILGHMSPIKCSLLNLRALCKPPQKEVPKGPLLEVW